MSLGFNFSNQTVVVIGGSRGIGRGIAEVFIEHGAHVVIASRNEQKLQETTRQLQEIYQREIPYCVCDVTNRNHVKDLVRFVEGRYSQIDVVVQSAGIYPSDSIGDMDLSEWDHVLNTNLTGTVNVIHDFFPTMKKRQKGRFVIISSITGPTVGNSKLTSYSASKAGLAGLVKSAAISLAKDQICINAIEPGNIHTESLAELGNGYMDEHLKAIPLGRLGTPQDVGHMSMFLASDQYAGFVTGQSFILDGGQVLPESHFDLESRNRRLAE